MHATGSSLTEDLSWAETDAIPTPLFPGMRVTTTENHGTDHSEFHCNAGLYDPMYRVRFEVIRTHDVQNRPTSQDETETTETTLTEYSGSFGGNWQQYNVQKMGTKTSTSKELMNNGWFVTYESNYTWYGDSLPIPYNGYNRSYSYDFQTNVVTITTKTVSNGVVVNVQVTTSNILA